MGRVLETLWRPEDCDRNRSVWLDSSGRTAHCGTLSRLSGGTSDHACAVGAGDASIGGAAEAGIISAEDAAEVRRSFYPGDVLRSFPTATSGTGAADGAVRAPAPGGFKLTGFRGNVVLDGIHLEAEQDVKLLFGDGSGNELAER